MTATERLRELLDERGVEYVAYGGKGHEDETGRPATWWSIEQGVCAAIQRDDDLLLVEARLTPEQAIAATLGRGECKLTMDGTDGCFGCSECLENVPPLANFCPNCGRKVVDE